MHNKSGLPVHPHLRTSDVAFGGRTEHVVVAALFGGLLSSSSFWMASKYDGVFMELMLEELHVADHGLPPGPGFALLLCREQRVDIGRHFPEGSLCLTVCCNCGRPHCTYGPVRRVNTSWSFEKDLDWYA